MFTEKTELSTDLYTTLPHNRSLFVIVVHFGSWEVTQTLLSSIGVGTMLPAHTIVIDHTKPGSNSGYAGGLHEGLVEAKTLGARSHDLIILINNDAKFAPDTLRTIDGWWKENGNSHTLAGAEMGYVSLVTGRARPSFMQLQSTWFSLPYVHGSCMVGEYSMFETLQIPVKFFLYWEDVEMSWQLMRSGGRIAHIPGLSITHSDEIGPISDQKLFYLVRNGSYLLEKEAPGLWKLYWRGGNSVRRWYHFLFRGTGRHAVVYRALCEARNL